jgi:hypothetical protein
MRPIIKPLPALIKALALALMAVAPSAVVASEQFGFSSIVTNGSGTDAQYSVTVYGSQDNTSAYGVTVGAHQALFVFRNTAAAASSISEIYFQDGTLLDIATVKQSAGVNYGSDPATPANLPGGNSLTPQFTPTRSFFSVDSENPQVKMGVNGPSEWVGILFDLKSPNDSYTAVVNALNQTGLYIGADDHLHGASGAPALRIGIHVTGLDGSVGSESFVSVANSGRVSSVPEPSTLALALCGLVGIGVTQFRRSRRNVPATM